MKPTYLRDGNKSKGLQDPLRRPPMFRMPTVFGPSPTPRRTSDGQVHDWSKFEADSVAINLAADRGQLQSLLPPRFELLDDPIVTLSFDYLRNLPWLGGRGYNTCGASIPVRFRGEKDTVVGSFLLVLWENMNEPILTGREELGFAKIYCEIPPLRDSTDSLFCSAAWDGFRFVSAEISNARAATADEAIDPLFAKTRGNLLHHRYMPRTGSWGEADIDQITLTPKAQGGKTIHTRIADVKVSWYRPNWTDMPTQHHIVGALADLCGGPVLRCSITQWGGAESDNYSQSIVE